VEFIDRLVEDARPVRRLWSPAVRLGVWLGVLLAVAAGVVIAGVRPDVAARLGSPGFLVELGCLAAATLAAAWLALRGAVPGLESPAGRGVLGATLVAGAVLGLAGMRPALAPTLASFVGAGIPCALSSVALALVPWAALLWAVRRGAPLSPVLTCAVGGLAAALGAYVLMRLRCPLDETLHVAAWHGAPVVLATIAAAAVGVLLVRARRVARSPV
jgi:hypothetical protein